MSEILNKSLYFNPAQLQSVLSRPKKEVQVWGRGTGKSSSFAWQIDQVTSSMPRSTSVIAGATYKQLLTKTIPPIIEALERLGYHKDVHYFIGKKPPASMRFAEPYQPSLDNERFWHFKNGSGIHLTSQDREGKSRGMNIAYVLADELLTMDKKKLEDEVFAANRGAMDRFGNIPIHHGWHLATSMPTSARGSWILDYSNYYQEENNPIWPTWNRICGLQLKFIDAKDPRDRQAILDDIKKLRKSIRFYESKEGVLFTVSNVFDNIRNIGMEYIKDMRRHMSQLSFRIEILNERITAIDHCFYKVVEDVHLYDAPNYSYIDNLEFNFEKLSHPDSRMDSDVDPSRPLDMGVDFGAVINAMRIGQEHSRDLRGNALRNYRFLKSFYVKDPKGLKDLAKDFAEYYRYHVCKEINLPYDHTAVGRDAVRSTLITELTKYLVDLGWKVNSEYIGQTAAHHNRYLLWEILLRGDDPKFPRILFNRVNDHDGILSMQLAGVKTDKSEFKKDKSSEQSSVIPREQATDLSDAGDILVWWKFGAQLKEGNQYYEVVIG